MSDETQTDSNVDNVNESEQNTDLEPQGSETDWKAEARKWEKRAKEANSFRDDAEKWAEYVKAQKPEQERIADELKTARAEAASSKVALLRFEVAAKHGIPTDAIKLLNGSSEEELEESAIAIMALVAKQSETKQPRPDASQGRPIQGGNSTADLFANAVSNLL
jgi:hypothetical protein